MDIFIADDILQEFTLDNPCPVIYMRNGGVTNQNMDKWKRWQFKYRIMSSLYGRWLQLQKPFTGRIECHFRNKKLMEVKFVPGLSDKLTRQDKDYSQIIKN